MDSTPKLLLEAAARIRQLAQNGLVYSEIEYDRERYGEILALSHRIAALVRDGGASETAIAALFPLETNYVTPKVDVRAAVFNARGEILLVQEKADGRWALPGGWADVGYTPCEVARKEVKEETGYDAEPLRLLAVDDQKTHPYPPALHYAYKLFILCRLAGGSPRAAFDTLGCGFFAEDALPPLSEERNLESQIRRMFRHYHNPGLPPTCD